MVYGIENTGEMKGILLEEDRISFVFFDSLVDKEGYSYVLIYGKRLVEFVYIDTTSWRRWEEHSLYEYEYLESFTHLEFPSDVPDGLENVFEMAKNMIEERWRGE